MYWTVGVAICFIKILGPLLREGASGIMSFWSECACNQTHHAVCVYKQIGHNWYKPDRNSGRKMGKVRCRKGRGHQSNNNFFGLNGKKKRIVYITTKRTNGYPHHPPCAAAASAFWNPPKYFDNSAVPCKLNPTRGGREILRPDYLLCLVHCEKKSDYKSLQRVSCVALSSVYTTISFWCFCLLFMQRSFHHSQKGFLCTPPSIEP